MLKPPIVTVWLPFMCFSFHFNVCYLSLVKRLWHFPHDFLVFNKYIQINTFKTFYPSVTGCILLPSCFGLWVGANKFSSIQFIQYLVESGIFIILAAIIISRAVAEIILQILFLIQSGFKRMKCCFWFYILFLVITTIFLLYFCYLFVQSCLLLLKKKLTLAMKSHTRKEVLRSFSIQSKSLKKLHTTLFKTWGKSAGLKKRHNSFTKENVETVKLKFCRSVSFQHFFFFAREKKVLIALFWI